MGFLMSFMILFIFRDCGRVVGVFMLLKVITFLLFRGWFCWFGRTTSLPPVFKYLLKFVASIFSDIPGQPTNQHHMLKLNNVIASVIDHLVFFIFHDKIKYFCIHTAAISMPLTQHFFKVNHGLFGSVSFFSILSYFSLCLSVKIYVFMGLS